MSWHTFLPPLRRYGWMAGLGLLLGAGLMIRGLQSPAATPVAASPAASPAAGEKTAKLVKLSPEALRNGGIHLAVAGPAVLEQSTEFPGRIAVDEHHLQAVASRFSGVITSMPLHAGQYVRQGELLAVLESRELADLRLEALSRGKEREQARHRREQERQLQDAARRLIALLRQGGDFQRIHDQALALPLGSNKAQLLEAYAQLRLTAETFNRERQLYESRVSSGQDFQIARKAYQSAQADYAAALEEITRQRETLLQERQYAYEVAAAAADTSQQKLRALGDTGVVPTDRLTRYEIRAPRAGTLIDKRAGQGESVNAETTLYLIADLTEVWAEMQIFETDLPAVKVGMPVMVWSQDRRFSTPGQLAHLKPIVDEQNRSAEAHAEIPNPQGHWFPGMYVSLELIKARIPVKLAVAAEALQRLEEHDVVFVQTPAGFVPRELRLGRRAAGQVEVLAGLAPGETYVSRGSFVLKSALLGQGED